MSGGGSKPGQRRGGRKPGTPNRMSRDLRETFIATFHALQQVKGANLTDWAKLNPEKFYPLAARLVPQQHVGDPDNPIRMDLSGQINLYIPDNGRARPPAQSPPQPRIRLRIPGKVTT